MASSSTTLLKLTPLQWNQPVPFMERHHNRGVLLYPKLQRRSKLIRLQISVKYNQSTSPDPDLRSPTNPFERIAIQVKKALEALKKPAVLLGLLLFYDPNSALAASGGRIGGNVFSSRSGSSSSSSSSQSYSRTSSSPSQSSSSSSSSQSYSVPRTSSSSSSSSSSSQSYSVPRSRSSSSSSSSQSDSVPRTSSSSSSFSSSSQSYSVPRTSSPSFSYSAQTAPHYGPSPYGGGSMGPAVGFWFGILVGFAAAFVLVSGFLSYRSQDDSILTDTQKTSVIKLQVGLLGLGRTLQQDFNRLAESADTSTPEGLSYVLTEATLALLRHPDYCISCYSSVDVKPSIEKGEERFNQLSIEERGKFDEETLVNVNSIKRQSSKIQKARGGFSNEYIVVTILVAAEGIHNKLKPINGSVDLKEALLKLGSIPRNKIMAVEVLWTPQNENDALSERELLEDYPLLRPL